MKNGDEFWCIRDVVESEDNRFECNEPVMPWKGVLKIDKNGVMYLHHNIEDDDTNSKAFVKECDLFATLDEAKIEFNKYCDYYIEEQQYKIQRTLDMKNHVKQDDYPKYFRF